MWRPTLQSITKEGVTGPEELLGIQRYIIWGLKSDIYGSNTNIH